MKTAFDDFNEDEKKFLEYFELDAYWNSFSSLLRGLPEKEYPYANTLIVSILGKVAKRQRAIMEDLFPGLKWR
jgi:hypothetical protein